MINGTAQEFQNFANQANKMMIDSWSNWTKQTIQSDSFASASSALMDWSMATHKMMTELQGQFMESLDIPKRSDLARISAQVQSLESRVLEQDDTQAEIKELLKVISAKLDNISVASTAAPADTEVPATTKKAVAKSVSKPSPTVVESVENTKIEGDGKTETARFPNTKPRAKRGAKKS